MEITTVNCHLKDHLRSKWSEWMLEGEKTYTAGGNIRAASLETVCQWVKESWEKIGEDMIKYSFKKCGISNLLDGSEDDVLWRDGDGEASDKVADEMDDVDLYDDMIGADDMEELFGDSDEDDE